MIIKSKHLSLITILIIFGSIAAASYLGFWKTTSDKSPAVYKSGSFTGQKNPADIRGSYAFSDISREFDIPVEDLGAAFGISSPSEYASFKCKDLEALYSFSASYGKEIGTGSVRYFTALYKGLPYDSSEITYLPKSAVEILDKKSSLDDDKINELYKYTVDLQ